MSTWMGRDHDGRRPPEVAGWRGQCEGLGRTPKDMRLYRHPGVWDTADITHYIEKVVPRCECQGVVCKHGHVDCGAWHGSPCTDEIDTRPMEEA